jgi:peroxiredoxin
VKKCISSEVLRPGDIAPEIDAVTSQGTTFRLSEQRSKLCTIIYFFPKAFTPGCTIETRRFRDNYPEMVLGGASVVGVSTDDHDTQCLFARSLRAPFPMIGDKDKTIAKAYDVLWPLVGRPMRVTFVVNALRTIEAVFHHEISIVAHRDEVLRIMDRLRAMRPRALPSAPPTSPAPHVAPALEPYELLGEAGAGAMGVVYRARERATGRIVALKLLSGAGDAARFKVEIVLLSKLDHPNIVRYIAHGGTEDNRIYLAMEWVDGESLSARLARGPLDVGEAVRVAKGIARGLAAAHASGVIHRDIKPSNVLVTRHGDVKLLDFGIARPMKKISTTLTGTGQLLGTPGYMAPEQIRNARVIDARADLFALGCLVFRCVAGRMPFAAEGMLETLNAVLHAPAPHLEGAHGLDALVQDLLAKDPAARPESTEAVCARLDLL